MGNQQAHRTVNEQVARAGRGLLRQLRVAARGGGRGSRVAVKTDRLDVWREDRFSRQVFE